MYKIDESENNVMTVKYGEWKYDVGLMVLQRNIWRRRANFKGHKIRYVSFFNTKSKKSLSISLSWRGL